MPSAHRCLRSVTPAICWAGAFAVGLLAPRAVQAQQAPARHFAFANVVGTDGAPLADAVVLFAGSVPHFGNVDRTVDVVAVASDARGRARARLLPGLCYVAWAVGPADAVGESDWASANGLFGAGALFELRCEHRNGPKRVWPLGIEPWQQRGGPLRYFAVTPMPGTRTELTVDDVGRVVIPPGPACAIEVVTADGEPLAAFSSTTDEPQIPPPQDVVVQTVDPRGNPVANVPILLRVARYGPWPGDRFGAVGEARLRRLGHTDADGKATFVVPCTVDPMVKHATPELLLLAAAPGRRTVGGGILNGRFLQDDQTIEKFADGAIRFTIRDADPLLGCCGPVPAGTQAILWAVCTQNQDRGDSFFDPRLFTAEVDERGTFAFPDVPRDVYSTRLALVGPDGRLPTALFGAVEGRRLPAAVSAVDRRASLDGELAKLELRVLDPTSGPASGVCGYLAPAVPGNVLLRDAVLRVALDAAGTARLPLEPGRWVALFVGAAGWVVEPIATVAGAMTMTLTMQPFARMELRLSDAAGQPLSGIGTHAFRRQTRGSTDPTTRLLQTLAGSLSERWQTRRSDDDGLLVLPFVPIPGTEVTFQLRPPLQIEGDLVLEATQVPREIRAK